MIIYVSQASVCKLDPAAILTCSELFHPFQFLKFPKKVELGDSTLVIPYNYPCFGIFKRRNPALKPLRIHYAIGPPVRENKNTPGKLLTFKAGQRAAAFPFFS